MLTLLNFIVFSVLTFRGVSHRLDIIIAAIIGIYALDMLQLTTYCTL